MNQSSKDIFIFTSVKINRTLEYKPFLNTWAQVVVFTAQDVYYGQCESKQFNILKSDFQECTACDHPCMPNAVFPLNI